MGIKPKEELFALEFVKDWNGAAAYRRAGYKGKGHTAEVEASRMIRKPQVKAVIDREMARCREKVKLSAERVLTELARVGFSDLGDVAEWDDAGVKLTPSKTLSVDARAALQEVSQHTTEHGTQIKVKLHGKIEALDKLAKHLNLYQDPDTLRQTRSVTINIIEGRQGPKVINGEDQEPPAPETGDRRRIEIRLPK